MWRVVLDVIDHDDEITFLRHPVLTKTHQNVYIPSILVVTSSETPTMTAVSSERLQHAAKESLLLPFALFTFFFWEFPKRLFLLFLNKLYELAQLPVIWVFKPVRIV